MACARMSCPKISQHSRHTEPVSLSRPWPWRANRVRAFRRVFTPRGASSSVATREKNGAVDAVAMLERAQSLLMRERYRRQRSAPSSYKHDDSQRSTHPKSLRHLIGVDQENVPPGVLPRRSASVKQPVQHRVPFAARENGVRLMRSQSARVPQGPVRRTAQAADVIALDRPLPPLPTRRHRVDQRPPLPAPKMQRPIFTKKAPFSSASTYPSLQLHEVNAERRPELRHTDEIYRAETLRSQRATVYIVTGTYGT